ncbi:hypothetical protein C6497_15155 [Candidatus Poribacteria bacterium]|nr:MAG: hypothetical protein C6497_15155 [Candidatus Poribacteria bacterium]
MNKKKTSSHLSLPICMLGADGHGKTTLTTVMERVIEKIGTIHSDSSNELFNQLPNHHPICEGVGFTYRSIDYETSGKHYTQIDCETHQDIVKLLVSGALDIQGAIWVVDADYGVTQESEELIRIANSVKVSNIVSFLNIHNTDDNELVNICKQEMTEILTECGWNENNTPILVGDAHNAINYKTINLGSDQWKPIVDTISALNSIMPNPINKSELHLMFPIHKIVEENKETVTFSGELIQGHLSVGQSIDIVGKGDRIKTKCLNIKDHEITVESEPDWLSVGQVVCSPKTIKAHTEFTAIVYLLNQDESGTHIPIVENDKLEIHLWGIDIHARVQLPPGLSIISPGSNSDISVSLDLPLVMEVGTTFEIKKMDIRIGLGIVTETV